MIREYKAGRTPNPDVMCNKEVKFGAFLKKALAMGADYVATGHYAKNGNLKNSPAFAQIKKARKSFLNGLAGVGGPGNRGPEKKNFLLCRGVDPSKDQSYFLWTLKQKQLSKILFPIGHLKKTEVRKLAQEFKLLVAEKKDSQGICFLGAVDLKEFLKHYIKPKKGEVSLVPSEAEGEKHRVIGYHDGAVFYTLGERHGFTITKKSPTDGAYYVVAKDIKKNTLTVSQAENLKNSPAFAIGDKRTGDPRLLDFSNFSLQLENTNWISEIPKPNKNYTAQIRYHGEFLPCQIKCAKLGFAQAIFNKPVLVASGQSCVIYDGDICLGGGVVK
jgi:tRNA-specific 2-thiouridylase